MASKKESVTKRIKGFFDERLGLRAFRYAIPTTSNTFGYALGSITLFTFIILGITGVILAVFYVPGVAGANASVALMSANPILNFLRGIHYWSAMIVPAIFALHLVRVVVTGAYKRPRELNFIVGVLMGAVGLAMIFSGTVLKWDQEGYEGLIHPMEIANGLGLWSLSSDPSIFLPLDFLLHVSVLPMLLILLFGAHALLIRIHGISEPLTPETRKTGEKQLTLIDHLKYASLYGLGFLVLVSILAIALPRTAGAPPVYGIEIASAPWFFIPIHFADMQFGPVLGLLVTPLVIIVLLLLVPFFDRSPVEKPKNWRHLLVLLFIFALLFAAVIFNVLYVVLPRGG